MNAFDITKHMNLLESLGNQGLTEARSITSKDAAPPLFKQAGGIVCDYDALPDAGKATVDAVLGERRYPEMEFFYCEVPSQVILNMLAKNSEVKSYGSVQDFIEYNASSAPFNGVTRAAMLNDENDDELFQYGEEFCLQYLQNDVAKIPLVAF